MPDGQSSLTRQLAAFAAQLTLADLSEPVRLHVKLHLLDTIGCGIAGAGSDLGRRALAVLDLEHRDGPCPVLGAGRRYGPAAAAFANAVAMNALDFDDGHEVDGKGMGHPSASLMAAALSAPFMRTVSGPAFLTALVAAYEVNARLIEAVQPTIERFRQVYGVCQHQGIGSAIAYGRQLDLAAPALENAIGFAATFANVPSLRKYNWERRPLVSFKDFNGPAAESGVRAVQFDAAGLDGARDVLDGESGFWRMIGSDRFDAAGLVAGLGGTWRLLSGSFKPYAACRWMHTAMEAFDALLAEHAIAPEEISAVTLHTSAGLARDFMDRRPTTMVDAQFSFPFAFAALAYRLIPAASWYVSEAFARDDLKAFADRVHAVIDPEVDAMMSGPARRPAGRVTIEARNVRFNSPLIHYPRGSTERPMTSAEVEAKFRLNAAPVLGAGRTDQLLNEMMCLEKTPDVASAFRGL